MVLKCAKRLKENPEVSGIPFFFIAAMGMPKDVLTGFKAGAVDYITKPVNLQEVCAGVKAHLTLSAAIIKLVKESEADSLTGLLNR
jgi:DNA-binding response OmpR family regulator